MGESSKDFKGKFSETGHAVLANRIRRVERKHTDAPRQGKTGRGRRYPLPASAGSKLFGGRWSVFCRLLGGKKGDKRKMFTAMGGPPKESRRKEGGATARNVKKEKNHFGDWQWAQAAIRGGDRGKL